MRHRAGRARLGALAALVLLAACASSGTASGPAVRDIARATQDWVRAYDSGNPARLSDLYATNAMLWGTRAERVAATPAEIAAFFKGRAGQKSQVILGEQHIEVFGDTAVNSGTYTFNNTQGDGRVVPLPARYTLVYRLIRGRWMIIAHHSSAMP